MNRALLVAGLMFPAAMAAQANAAVQVSVALWGGDGSHTSRSGALYYYRNNVGNLFGGVSLALKALGRFEPMVEYDHTLIDNGDKVSVCQPAPNGTCYGSFPRVTGELHGAGVRVKVTDRVRVGATVGAINFEQRGRYAGAELSVRAIGPLELTARIRHGIVRNHGDTEDVWYRNVGLGLRLSRDFRIP